MIDIDNIIGEKYKVIKLLGNGGMGTVYLCKNILLNNLWAVKEMKMDINIDAMSEPNILKKLEHTGIPRLLDVFYENDNLYMVEDYIDGQTLKQYIHKNGVLTPEEICKIILSLCDILVYLHGLNPPIIYRDLKPSNIMITTSGKIMLIDFGISKLYIADEEADTIPMGSNGYAAPEQQNLEHTCKQTDIYGIGMVMYFMAVGKAASTVLDPFVDESYGDNIDSNLKKIIQHCSKTDINERYTSVEELITDIRTYVGNADYEKTMVLNEESTVSKVKTRKYKPKVLIATLLIVFAAIIAILYHNFSNYLKFNNTSTTISPKVDTNIKTVPAEEDSQLANTPTSAVTPIPNNTPADTPIDTPTAVNTPTPTAIPSPTAVNKNSNTKNAVANIKDIQKHYKVNNTQKKKK